MSVVRQCELLSLPRSTFYYQPVATQAGELELMPRIRKDEDIDCFLMCLDTL